MVLPISTLKRLLTRQKWNIRITDFYLHNQPVRQGVLSGGREIINEPVFEAKI